MRLAYQIWAAKRHNAVSKKLAATLFATVQLSTDKVLTLTLCKIFDNFGMI